MAQQTVPGSPSEGRGSWVRALLGQKKLCQCPPRAEGAVPGLLQGQRELCQCLTRGRGSCSSSPQGRGSCARAPWGKGCSARTLPGHRGLCQCSPRGREICAGVSWGKGELCQGSPRAEGAVLGLNGAWELCCVPTGQLGVVGAGVSRRCPAKDPVVLSASDLLSIWDTLCSPTCCHAPLGTHPWCQQSWSDRKGLKLGCLTDCPQTPAH